jgi:hypothetical protein
MEASLCPARPKPRRRVRCAACSERAIVINSVGVSESEHVPVREHTKVPIAPIKQAQESHSCRTAFASSLVVTRVGSALHAERNERTRPHVCATLTFSSAMTLPSSLLAVGSATPCLGAPHSTGSDGCPRPRRYLCHVPVSSESLGGATGRCLQDKVEVTWCGEGNEGVSVLGNGITDADAVVQAW